MRDETVVGERGSCAECNAALTLNPTDVDAGCVMFCNDDCIVAWAQRIGLIKVAR